MGRKRNQGKARRAAKAKAMEEVEERGRNDDNNPTTVNNSSEEADERDNNQATTIGQEQSLASQLRQLQAREECMHGFDLSFVLPDDSPSPVQLFASAFHSLFHEAIRNGRQHVRSCLTYAFKSTVKFANVWNDSAKMEMAIACFLCMGTQDILEGNHEDARKCATFVRYFEQQIAIAVKRTQALHNWIKVDETFYSDDHTLVKFFRHRISCSCLDGKYEEVKHITKIGHCYNPQCSLLPRREVERSKAKYCSRCRNSTYCSRECQVLHWTQHERICDEYVAYIAERQSLYQSNLPS